MAANPPPEIVVDAQNQIVGRLASQVAKALLNGQRVVILNAEKAVFSGHRRMVIRERLAQLKIASVTHPKHGPFHPRTPDRILTRIIRGMLPRRKPRGVAALKRLRVYVNTPRTYAHAKQTTFPAAQARRPLPFYVPLADVARELGWQGV